MLLTVGVVAIIALTDRLLFLPETEALAWHIGHGFALQTNGVNFNVPILYQADLSIYSSHPTLTLVSGNGKARFTLTRPSRLRMGRIVFWFYKSADAPPEVVLGRIGDAWITDGYQQTGERLASLAGRQGKCREYSGPPLHDEKISFGDKDVEILCYFGNDVLAVFGGTPTAVDDFYDIVRSAQVVKGQG